MTILQCVNELEELIRINNLTEEGKLSRRLLLQFMNIQRALWIKNEQNKGRSIEDNIRQSINGIKLVPVNASTTILDSAEYNVIRSKYKIPNLIEQSHDYNVISIRTSGLMDTKLNYVHRDRIANVGKTRFTKGKPYVTLYNNYIYLLTSSYNANTNLIDLITIEGIFENPELVYTYGKVDPNYINGTTGTNDVFAEKYPISMAMWTYIKNAILQTDITVLMNSKLKEKQLDATT